MSDITSALAVYLEQHTDYDVTAKARSVVIDGDFEMFGGADVKAEITRFFSQRQDVAGYTVGVQTPAGEVTGPMVVDEIVEVPNA